MICLFIHRAFLVFWTFSMVNPARFQTHKRSWFCCTTAQKCIKTTQNGNRRQKKLGAAGVDPSPWEMSGPTFLRAGIIPQVQRCRSILKTSCKNSCFSLCRDGRGARFSSRHIPTPFAFLLDQSLHLQNRRAWSSFEASLMDVFQALQNPAGSGAALSAPRIFPRLLSTFTAQSRGALWVINSCSAIPSLAPTETPRAPK